MMNICSTCQGAQSECQERLDADRGYRDHVNSHLDEEGLTYERDGEWWNKNFLWLLVEEIGLDKVKEKVVRPLTGLRIAPFYGCYIVRPTKRLGYEAHPNRDKYLDFLIEVLGAEPVQYAGSHKCCGFPVITMNQGHLAAPGGPAPRGCHRRRRRLPRHALPALPPQPGHAAAGRRQVRGARPRRARAAPAADGWAWPLGSRPTSWGWTSTW